jgi:multidrug efflux pump subunit AcrA (membrane-fusion protein)
MLKKKRTWIILGIAAVLIGGGIYLATRTSGQASASQLLANAQTATVVQTTLFTSVDSTGSIMPEASLDLSFGTSGTVDQVKVVVGDQVKKGDVLATLDSAALHLKVTRAEQSYSLFR